VITKFFDLGEQLGAGGLGSVHRARDQRTGRQLALKRFAPALAPYVAAARPLVGLCHPRLVEIVEVGDGWLTMPLYEGESLAARLAIAPLPLASVVELGVELAAGLAALHERGVIHRDVTPENVLCGASGALLLDVADGVIAAAQLRATGSSARFGTPFYMAPEIVRREPVDARADIYALGLVLFEALAGEPAFAGESIDEVFQLQLDEPLPALELLPPALDELLTTMCAKDPGARVATARGVEAALVALREAPLAER
jgi:serine/threonine protein kinase